MIDLPEGAPIAITGFVPLFHFVTQIQFPGEKEKKFKLHTWILPRAWENKSMAGHATFPTKRGCKNA